MKKTFKQYLAEVKKEDNSMNWILVLEHEVYKSIPKTNNFYREDPANTNTLTQQHAHVYAKNKSQLYAMNLDGTGHDGSSGKEIPKKHAEFFKGKGYTIPSNYILESFDENLEDEFDPITIIVIYDDELI